MQTTENKLKGIAALSAIALGVLVAVNAFAQVTEGKSQPLKTSHWMKGVVKPHCNAVKETLKEGPADDDAWEELAMHAGIINESSYILMADGRCPDKVWAEATTKKLRAGSADLLKAAEDKDLEAARAAFKVLGSSCKACHSEHKED